MALIVGNLLTDPAAQSFISLADADAYLAPEQNAAWGAGTDEAREAALVRASRWLAGSYNWNTLAVGDLARVGIVAARLAAETMGRNIYAGTDAAAVVEREKIGSIDITYRGGLTADAAGLILPWLAPALSGLIRTRAMCIGIMVV